MIGMSLKWRRRRAFDTLEKVDLYAEKKKKKKKKKKKRRRRRGSIAL